MTVRFVSVPSTAYCFFQHPAWPHLSWTCSNNLLLFLDHFGGAIALPSLSNGIGVPRSLAHQGNPFHVLPPRASSLAWNCRGCFFFTPRKRGNSPTMPLSLCYCRPQLACVSHLAATCYFAEKNFPGAVATWRRSF